MRVVSGTAGSGGSDAFTTTFGSGKTTASHTLTASQMPAHTHSVEYRGNGTSTGNWPSSTSGTTLSTTKATLSTGGAGAHSHNLSGFNLQYVDVIIATKD